MNSTKNHQRSTHKSPNRTTSPPALTQLFVLLLPLPMLPPKVSPRSIWIGGGWVIADIMVALVLNMSATKRKNPPGKVEQPILCSLSNLCQGYQRLLVGRTDKACALQEANDHIITVMWPCRKGRLKVPHMMSFRKPLK